MDAESQPSTSAGFRSNIPHEDEPRRKKARIYTPENDESSTSEKMDVEEIESLPWLPDEMWSEIFSHLLFRDRMNARLVCQFWYDRIVNNARNDEKLLCSAPYNWETVMGIIQQSKRKTLNLEIQRMKISSNEEWFDGRQRTRERFSPLQQRTREFWEQCGPRMKSLILSDFAPTDEVIQYVVQYCTNLESLTLEWSRVEVVRRKLRMCYSKCIVSLIRMNVTRDSLAFFELRISDSSCITNNFLWAINRVYPKIKRFSIVCGTVDPGFGEEDIPDQELEESARRCTATGIVNELIKSNQLHLEGIYLSIGDYQQLSYYNEAEKFTSSVVSLHFPRLREVELELMMFDQEHRDFFSRHNNLTAVDLELFTTNAAGEDMTHVMNSVLDSCPNLRSLRLILKCLSNTNTTPPAVSSSVFAKIAKSRLRVLTFNYELAIAPEDTETVNYHLESLCIAAPGIGSDEFRVFMKVFQCLSHLEVNEVQDDGLQAIFQYQRYLKSLRLTDFHNCTDYGFTGCRSAGEGQREGFSVQRLSGLQYLDLQTTKDPENVTEKTTREFKLPNLLYLYVAIDRCVWKAHNDFMSVMLENSLKLEGIMTFTTINWMSVQHTWVPASKLLKNLRYLKVAYERPYCGVNPTYQFDSWQSLRAVSFQIRSIMHSRYYDVVERKTKAKNDTLEYRISSKPIDSKVLTVDKMWF